MRVLATLIFVLLVVLGLGFWATWAAFDVMHDAVIQVNDTTVTVGHLGLGSFMIAGFALAAVVVVVVLVALVAVPLAFVAALGAMVFGLGIALAALLGAIGFAFWPVLVLGALIWWLARRSRTAAPSTPAR
jgi:hypothetical protein